MKFRITLIMFLLAQFSFLQNISSQDSSVPDLSVPDRYVIPALAPLPVQTAPEIPTTGAVWQMATAQMAAGEQAVFTLRITGWGGQLPQEFFMPEVPPGAILAPLPVSAEERASGAVLKLRLIPLDGDFNLPARVLQYENIRFEIPPLHIKVTGLAVKEQEQSSPHSETVSSDNKAQFPSLESAGKPKNSKLEDIYNTARNLWNDGLHAQALAELRRNERDHSSGAALAAIRRSAEESLGIFNTEDESRLRRKLFLGLSLFFIHLVIISMFVCFALIRKPPSLWKKTAMLTLVVSAVLTLLCILLAGSGVKNSRSAVTEKTPVRRTADLEGEELFSFREGQPVVILLNSGLWVYVRANDAGGGTGWIPAEEVIFY